MKMLESLMEDRISIFRPSDTEGATFNEETLEIAEGSDTLIYSGPAMISSLGGGTESDEEGYRSTVYSYRCRFPLSKKVEPVLKGDRVVVTSVSRPELRNLVGRRFYVEGEAMGSFSASRAINMTYREAVTQP